MKATIIYRTLLISILIFLASSLAAQCPVTASLKITDAGGCGTGTLGIVEFQVKLENSSNTEKTYYLVYDKDGNTLVNNPTNTNTKVTLPPETYLAKVITHCKDGQTNEWTQLFTINLSTETTFTVKSNGSKSRGRSLRGINSGMLAFDIEGLGVPVTAEIKSYIPLTEYKYTGPMTFEFKTADTHSISDLAPGTYVIEFSNGCVPPITLSGLSVTETEQDLPTKFPATVTLSVRNNDPDVDNWNRPSEDYNQVYFAVPILGSGSLPPIEYWNKKEGSPYYEYGYAWGNDLPTEWFDESNSVSGNVFSSAKIETPANYTISKMLTGAANRPNVYYRVKGGKSSEALKIQTTFALTTSSTSSGRLTVFPSSTSNCNILDFSVALSTFSHATFPFSVQLIGTTTEGGTSFGDIGQPYVVNSKEDLKATHIVFKNVTVPTIYKEVLFKVICPGTTGDTPYELRFNDRYKTDATRGYGIQTGSQGTLSRGCESNFRSMFLTNAALRDFSEIKVKYVSGPTLPTGMLSEITVPANANTTTLYMSADPSKQDPWSSNVSGSPHVYRDFQIGTYVWEITTACKQVFTTSITITAPQQATGMDASFLKPKVVGSSSCNRVQVNLGTFADLKRIFPNEVGTNPKYTGTTLVLCKKVMTAGAERYQVLSTSGVGTEVYYDGNGTNFTTTDANAIYTNPKLELTIAGTFYLFAVPYFGITNSYNPINFPTACMTYQEIVIDEGDLKLVMNNDRTKAYFCDVDETKGNIFVARKGTPTDEEYTFTVTNGSTFTEVLKSKDLAIVVAGIDIAVHGTQYKVIIDPPAGCSTQGVEAILEMSTISNSVTFITQNKNASCEGGIDIEIAAIPYLYTSYEWFNSLGTSLGVNNTVTGKFVEGDILTLKIFFNSLSQGSVNEEPCNPWVIDYVVKGSSEDYYWKVQSVDNNWNNRDNWTLKDGSAITDLPGPCSAVFIPSVSNQFPDLKVTLPQAVTTDIYFEFGAQLYNQQNLMYESAYIQYDFAYYNTLNQPAPEILVQPNASNSQALKGGVAFVNLPKIERARWYMLSTPLKGMVSADFQFGGKPFVNQRFYKNVATGANLMIKDGFVISPEQDTAIESVYNGIAIWMAPYAKATGAEDQNIVQNLKGGLLYPYFKNDEIMSARTDRTFNSATNTMSIKGFNMENLSETSAKSVARSTKANRFVYEDVTGAMPAGGYTITIAADAQRTAGEVMIGNPFMAPLDFTKFLTENASVIDNVYKIISIKAGVETILSYPSASELGSTIAVQQAFIIKLKNPTSAATLKFPVSTIANQTTTTSSQVVL